MRFFYLPIRERENVGDGAKQPLTHELEAMEWLFYVPVGHTINPLNSRKSVKTTLDSTYDFDDELTPKVDRSSDINFETTMVYYNDYQKVHSLINDKNGDYSIKENVVGTPALFVSYRNIRSWFVNVIKPEILQVDKEIQDLEMKLKSKNYVASSKTNQSNHKKRLVDYRFKLILALDVLNFLKGSFGFVEDHYKIINESSIKLQIQEEPLSIETLPERADTLIFQKINEERRSKNQPLFKTFRYDFVLNQLYDLWKKIHLENRKLFDTHVKSKQPNKNKQKKNQTWALRKVIETIYYVVLELNNTSSTLKVYCQEPKVIFSKDNVSCEKRFIEKNIPKSRKM